MLNWLLVAAGGAVGAVLRFGTHGLVTRVSGMAFPYATLTVNVLGSFVMGLVAMWLLRRGGDVFGLRLFIMTGILGGFTTFSAFSLDVFDLWQREAFLAAGLYIISSVIVSIAALFAGIWLARSFV